MNSPPLLLSRRAYRAFLVAVFLAGAGVVICSLLIIRLIAVTDDNHALIDALSKRDQQLSAQYDQQAAREDALRAFVYRLQAQVKALGATPPVLPPDLATTPPSPGSRSTPGPQLTPTPRSSVTSGPSPTPRPTSTPAPTRTPAPTPTPTSPFPPAICKIVPALCQLLPQGPGRGHRPR